MRLEARRDGTTSGSVDTIQNREEDKLKFRRTLGILWTNTYIEFSVKEGNISQHYLIVCDLFHPPIVWSEKRYPGDDIRCWPDPADHDKQARGEVVGDHVEGHLPGQHKLEARGAVVHPDGLVVRVAWVQGLEGDLVVQDGLDAVIIRNKLKRIMYILIFCVRHKTNNPTSDRKVILLIG